MREKVAVISEKIPNAGKIRIYTSGCPHAQIRFTYIIWFPPRPLVKNAVPKYLSSVNKVIVTVKIGNAMIINTFADKDVQVNTGICINFIPGARILRIVTKKFTPVSNVPIPDICSAQSQ